MFGHKSPALLPLAAAESEHCPKPTAETLHHGKLASTTGASLDGKRRAAHEKPDAEALGAWIAVAGDDWAVLFDTRDGRVTRVRRSCALGLEPQPRKAPRVGRTVGP